MSSADVSKLFQATEKDNRNMHAVVEQFCRHLKDDPTLNGRLLMKRSAQEYAACARRLARTFTAENTIADLTPARFRRYIRLFDEKHHPNTTRREFSLLRGFARWCVAEGYLVEDVTQGCALPAKQKPQHDTITKEQAQALLSACDRFPDEPKRLMTRAVLSMMLLAGLRRGEVCSLKLRDINLAERKILIFKGKGGKTEPVFISRECAQALRDWLAIRPQVRYDEVFVYNNAYHMSGGYLGTLQREIYAIAQVSQPSRYNHCLRHNFARRLKDKGANIYDIMHAMRHNRMETTEVYLSTDEERMREVAEMAAFEERKEAKEKPVPSLDGKKRRRLNLKKKD